MSATTRTIWLDVTDLMQWNGHMTGVQRVVYENMCRLYADESIMAKGFSYDSYRKEVFTVNLADVIARIRQPARASSATAATASRLKTVSRNAYFKLPETIRRRITTEQKQLVVRTARRALHLSRRSVEATRRLRSNMSAAESRQPALFGQDDTVLVLGKVWDSTPLVDLLATRKRDIGFRYVQLIHDTIPVTQPQLFGPGLFEPYAQYLFETLASADMVLCVSKSTKRDMLVLAEQLHFPEPNTAVIENGDTPLIDVVAERPEFVRPDEQFLLMVGTIEARKNHAILYQTWKLAAERGVTLPRMIVVGSTGWLVENMMYITSHDPVTKDTITFHHGVPDAQVKWLYEHCLFTVYPSIYEGWGIPIAESLSYGKICIPSKTSSMPEIAGDILEYVSPFDAADLLEKILHYQKPANRITKENYIQTHYKSRSWDESYGAIRKLLD